MVLEKKPFLLSILTKNLSKPSFSEQLLLIAVSSIFLPFVITCLVAIYVGCYAILNKNARKRTFRIKGNIFLFLFAILLIVVPLSYGRLYGTFAGVLGICILTFFLFAQSIMTTKLYNRTFDICCAMSIVPFIYALIQKFVMGWEFRSTGGLLNANYYATVIEFVILICVYRMITTKKSAMKYIPVILINIGGLFFCDSQSAWLPVVVGVLILLYFNGYKKHTLIFLGVSITLGIVFICVPGILPRLDRMSGTFETRINIWQTAIEGIKQSPVFGRGPLTYLDIYEQFDGYKTYHAHSLYIEPFLSHGIVGVTAILIYFLQKILFISKTKFGVNNRAIKSVMLAGVVAVMIHGITDYSIFWVQTGMLICLIVSAIGIKEPEEVELSIE